jgi:hypothetical protein
MTNEKTKRYIPLLFAVALSVFPIEQSSETNTNYVPVAIEIQVDPEPVELTQDEIILRRYLKAFAFRESSGVADTVNRWGYMGLYQFGMKTLRGIGYTESKECFLADSAVQTSAMLDYMRYNRGVLYKQIARYQGQTIDGIYITESGILAAAHLAGAGNVKKWFRRSTKGRERMKDALGTTVSDYMRKFSNYRLVF